MPAKIDQQTTSDNYTDPCTISGVFGSNGGYFNVTGADAFVELGYGKQGQEQWTGETHLASGSTGAILQGTTGIRFRSYTAGSPSTISAAIYYPAEPSLILSSPGTANVTTNVGWQHNGAAVASQATLDFEDAGANVWTVANDAANSRVKVTPPKFLTGIVAANGTILGGTGFSVVNGSAGVYTVTFTVAFAARPTVVATLADNTTADYVQTASSSVNGFTANTRTTAGTLQNSIWNFIAFATS